MPKKKKKKESPLIPLLLLLGTCIQSKNKSWPLFPQHIQIWLPLSVATATPSPGHHCRPAFVTASQLVSVAASLNPPLSAPQGVQRDVIKM